MGVALTVFAIVGTTGNHNADQQSTMMLAMPMKATPMVAIVVHELPLNTDITAHTAHAVTRNADGLSDSRP